MSSKDSLREDLKAISTKPQQGPLRRGYGGTSKDQRDQEGQRGRGSGSNGEILSKRGQGSKQGNGGVRGGVLGVTPNYTLIGREKRGGIIMD